MRTIQSNRKKSHESHLCTSRAMKFAQLTEGNSGEVKHPIRQCNICRQRFIPEYRYQLFCGKCRSQDDSFLFNEWLPRAPESVSMELGY